MATPWRTTADKAARLMIVDKLESLAQVQASAIANIGFEKVVVYDSGNGNSVGNFLGGLTRALPPFHEVAKMAGIELPEFLGELAERAGKASGEGGDAGTGKDAGAAPAPSGEGKAPPTS